MTKKWFTFPMKLEFPFKYGGLYPHEYFFRNFGAEGLAKVLGCLCQSTSSFM